MTDVAMVDYRRTDLRTNVLLNPYWITSGLVVGADCEDKFALLFSFPVAGKLVKVLDVVVQIVVACTSSTLIDIGYSTIATDAVTTGGVATRSDDDEYVKQTDITVGTPGFYRVVTAHASDWHVLLLADSGIAGDSLYILGAATTVPCVTSMQSNTGTIAAGSWRVHMLITEIPGSF
jgi:hypothetical protein